MNPCVTDGCDSLRTPGRGTRYCAACRADAIERRKVAAVRGSAKWRRENREHYKQWSDEYYRRTGELQREKAKTWYYANPERVREGRLKQRAKKLPRVTKYGMTINDYKELLAAQGGCCAICGRTENGKRHNFDVDHDHESGAVRGLLCNRCNRLLSNALDDPRILASAADYLSGVTRQESA